MAALSTTGVPAVWGPRALRLCMLCVCSGSCRPVGTCIPTHECLYKWVPHSSEWARGSRASAAGQSPRPAVLGVGGHCLLRVVHLLVAGFFISPFCEQTQEFML